MTNQPKVPISNNFFYIFPLLTLCPAEASLHSAQEQKVLEKMNKLRIKFQVHRLYGYIIKQVVYNNVIQGSGCGSVGKAVASNPEVHGSNPVIGKNLYWTFTQN